MRKCSRCHTSMLLDYTDTADGYVRMWKCLGCGREMRQDPLQEQTEQQDLERVRREVGAGRGR